MIKLTCLPLLAVLSFVSLNAYSEKLDDLLRQQKSTKAEQRPVKGMDGVIEEYRSLLIFQIDDSGRLIRTSFQYKGSSDLVQYEAEPDLSQYISHALHSEYKIPQGCIDSGYDYLRTFADLLTASYAKQEATRQQALVALNSDLEQSQRWIEWNERNTPGKCSNAYSQFRKMVNDLLVGVQNAPQEAVKWRKQFIAQRNAEIQAQNEAEQAKQAAAAQIKTAQADAAKAQEQQSYDICTKEYGIPATVVKRTLNMYAGGMVGLCRFVLGARDAGVGITFGKGSNGAPYSIEMKKGSGRITMGLDVLKDVVTGEENRLLLVPVNYSVNGPNKRLENANDLGNLLMGISSMVPPKI